MSEHIDSRKNFESVLRIFPYLDDREKAKKLQIDDEALCYITHKSFAEKICEKIIENLKSMGIDSKECTITDATAGVGGNVFSFSKNFKKVNAIEIDKKWFAYLKNNTSLYNLSNIEFFNEDCMKRLGNLGEQDVVFIDPPWGGRSYKDEDKMRLKINEESIESICNDLFDIKKTKSPPKIIALKLPKNYDVKYLQDNVRSQQIYFFNLYKMFFFIIKNPNLAS